MPLHFAWLCCVNQWPIPFIHFHFLELPMISKYAKALALVLPLLLGACGGSSSSDSTASTTTTTTTAAPSPADYAARYVGSVAGITSALDTGSFDFTVASNGSITGTAVVKNLPFTLTGSVNSSGVVAMGLYAANGFHGHNWDGQITKPSGAVSGTWYHAWESGVNKDGTFSGAATTALPASGTTTTTTTATSPTSFAGRYVGDYDSPVKLLCVDAPGLDPTGHGTCGQRYTLAGGIDFTVDANNNLTGSLYVFGPAASGTVCAGTKVNANGTFSFTICAGEAAGVNGSGTFANGRMTGRLVEGPYDWKYGDFDIARQ
jgi:hypothetical protein